MWLMGCSAFLFFSIPHNSYDAVIYVFNLQNSNTLRSSPELIFLINITVFVSEVSDVHHIGS